MPSKAYSKQQREEIRQSLLEVGLALYAKEGIKKVRLEDILKVVNISKPFFYTYFESVQEFVIQILEYQWQRLDQLIDELEANASWTWRQKAEALMTYLVHHREHGLLVMTQDEEFWVRGRLEDTRYRSFMDDQIAFFAKLLHLWEISEDACDPRVLGNMILTIIVVKNSAVQSLPFFYLDQLEQTAQAQINSILAYLENFRQDKSEA